MCYSCARFRIHNVVLSEKLPYPTQYSLHVVSVFMHVLLFNQTIEFLAEFENKEIEAFLRQIGLVRSVVHQLAAEV